MTTYHIKYCYHWSLSSTSVLPLYWMSSPTDKRVKGWSKLLTKSEGDKSYPTKG
jgi:hypothetical protein